MKINKLSVLIIFTYFLVGALWSEVRCMDNLPDIEEKTSYNGANNIQSSTKSEVDALTFDPIPYLISPAIKIGHDIVSCFSRNPKLAIMVTLSYIIPSATACACWCNVYHYIGDEPSVRQCMQDCAWLGEKFTQCV